MKVLDGGPIIREGGGTPLDGYGATQLRNRD